MKKDKENKKEVMATPNDHTRIMSIFNPYLHGVLKFQIDTKRCTAGQGNAYYKAFNNLWRLAQAMEAAHLTPDFLIELCEHLFVKIDGEVVYNWKPEPEEEAETI